jgi:hypothetical protein
MPHPPRLITPSCRSPACPHRSVAAPSKTTAPKPPECRPRARPVLLSGALPQDVGFPDAMSRHPPLLRRGHLISDSLHRPSSGPATTTVGSVCGVVFLYDSSASASDCHFDLLLVTTTTQSSSLGSTSFGEFFLTPTPQIVGLSHWCHPVPFPPPPVPPVCQNFGRRCHPAAMGRAPVHFLLFRIWATSPWVASQLSCARPMLA